MALAHNFKKFLGLTEEAPEAEKDSALTPEFYFSAERVSDIAGSIGRLSSISVNNIKYSDNQKEKSSELKVEFKRDGKLFEATFTLEREKTGSAYKMTAEVYSERGKEIFTKTLTGRDALQVPMAIAFVFHEAFEQNE